MLNRTLIGIVGMTGGVAALATLSVDATPQPFGGPADNCGSAPLITEGTYSGSTSGANSDGSANCGSSSSSPDVWYRFQSDAVQLLTVSTCGVDLYDTVLSIHSGCPGTSSNQLSCNDDACGLRSTTAATLDVGDEVWIRVSGYNGASGQFQLTVSTSDPPSGGPDVVYSDATGISNWGVVGGIRGYSLGSHTCNIGGENLLWGSSNNGTPVLGMNGYRLHEGRLQQIGMSFAKHGTGAAAGSGCGLPCNGQGGSVLGAGCLDVYSSGFNGIFSILGPRSDVNAWTGALLSAPSGSGNDIYRRLQIAETDLGQSGQGALYFVEGVYVALDDAGIFGNAYNNASYKRVTIGGGFDLNVTGDMNVGEAAIHAWRDHGNGVGVPDPSVEIQDVDVPGEGRFVAGHKVTDNGDGTYTYDYAVFNLNSDRSGGSFSVPIPAGVNVTDIGFHDVDYHSGEIYDNTDWSTIEAGGAVTWSSPQTHAQNPNSNALRWGTMYNFWLTADSPPESGAVTLGLFKPGTPTNVDYVASVPMAGTTCTADLDGNGVVDVADLLALIAAWGTAGADLTGDGTTDVADMLELLAQWGDC